MVIRKALTSITLVPLLFLGLILVATPNNVTAIAAGEQVTLSQYLVPEGRDFSTLEFGDPWDMEEYSDVSMYINESNTALHLENIEVSGGKFSARSVDTDAQFHVLFPGYQSSIPAGKTGTRHPINPSNHCLFTLMNVQSVYPLDEVRVWWFANNKLTGEQFGSGRLSTFPFSPGWSYLAADLNSLDGTSGDSWSGGVEEWQGLRLDPTVSSGVEFEVDWVRLTDCGEVPVTVSWSGISGGVQIWVGIETPQPDFEVPIGMLSLKDCDPDSCVLDVQGWEPGLYYIGVRRVSDGQFFWTSQPLVINPSPILDIIRPSFTSGESIVWNMNSQSGIVPERTICVDYIFDQGELYLITKPPAQLPGGCVSSGSSDPQVVLSQNGDVDTTSYRYLTFQALMEGQWQDVNRGWIMRWIWSPYNDCFLVSNDIPFDVGWQTLTIDLHDSFEGLAEDAASPPTVNCPINHWTTFPATYLRFDPNENTTSVTFHQRMDWIRLSRMDRVTQGDLYPIQIQSSENIDDLSLNFYFTTNPDGNPKQQVAVIKTGPSTPPGGPYTIFLPMIFSDYEGSNFTTYLWDTSGVSNGQYYICVEASDGLNIPTYCSEAPVDVTTN